MSEKTKLPCPCQNTSCQNHGCCVPCVENHRKNGNLPACMREIAANQGK